MQIRRFKTENLKPVAYSTNANAEIFVKAVRTKYDGWGTMSAQAPGRAKDPPASPIPTSSAEGDVEEIELGTQTFSREM